MCDSHSLRQLYHIWSNINAIARRCIATKFDAPRVGRQHRITKNQWATYQNADKTHVAVNKGDMTAGLVKKGGASQNNLDSEIQHRYTHPSNYEHSLVTSTEKTVQLVVTLKTQHVA